MWRVLASVALAALSGGCLGLENRLVFHPTHTPEPTAYQEKHRVNVCRFGLTAGAAFAAIEDDWVLDGGQLGHWCYGETLVRRLTIPGLTELHPLSAPLPGTRR
ncbi:MAG TPA: hypothetical protein VKE74_13725 [Gemmataceae bacterium]|nr:hypothetical protein [Gemmataceae bacterium]